MSKLYCGNAECGEYLGSMGADNCVYCGWVDQDAIESAATEPLMERIAELERENEALRAQLGQGVPDGLRAEAKKLAPILASMGEGGYDLETLYVEDPVDGDCFVKRAADLLLLLASAPPAPQDKRCKVCNYQHGHQIGCENNPVDIALKAQASAVAFCTYPKCQTTGMKCAGQCSQAARGIKG